MIRDEASFWSWFSTRADALAEANIRPELYEELNRRVRALGVSAWELGPDPITNGLTNYFSLSSNFDDSKDELVERLVRSAPPLPGWRISRYRQKKLWGGQLQMRHSGRVFEIDCTKWLFSFSTSKTGMILDICIPPEEWTKSIEPRRAAFIFILNEIGEQDFVSHFTDFDVEDWRECSNDPMSMPFLTFREYWKSVLAGCDLH